MFSEDNSPVTPKKSPRDSFSPIIIPSSPADLVNQKNITGLPRVLRDLAADLYNNIQKWNDNHIKGAAVVKQIAILKSDSKERLPPGLEQLVKDLHDLTQRLSFYCNSLGFLRTQAISLLNMKPPPEPIFIKLSLEQITNLVKGIVYAYEQELRNKLYVVENIAHARTKDEVMFFASCWVHQVNITKEVGLKVEILLNETNHRKMV